MPGGQPVVVEHEYARKGAWNLFAAFDIQTGQVIAQLHRRKRQKETIALLEAIDQDTPRSVATIHVVCDNVSIHKGKLARARARGRGLRYPLVFLEAFSS